MPTQAEPATGWLACHGCSKARAANSELCPHCGAPKASAHIRSVGLLLVLGIIFVPFIFGWFTFRRGHSLASRVLAVGWMIMVVVAIGADQQSP